MKSFIDEQDIKEGEPVIISGKFLTWISFLSLRLTLTLIL